MRLKVKLVGIGTETDPHRVNLPTWKMVTHDPGEGWAIVEIPDGVHGLPDEDLAHETLVAHETGDHYAALCDGCIGKMHDHMDERYQEHSGEFRVELA